MMKKKPLYLLFMIILFVSSTVSLSQQLRVNAQTGMDEDLFLLLNRTGDEIGIESKSIVDASGNFHFLARILYENGTFMIIHKVNDETNIVIIEENSIEYFELFSIDGGIELFYAFHTFFGYMKFHRYNWTETAGPIDGEFYAYNAYMNYPRMKIYYEENNTLFMVLAFIQNWPPLSEISTTRFEMSRFYENGTQILEKIFVLDYEFDFLVDFHYANGTLYSLYRYTPRFSYAHWYGTIVTKGYSDSYVSNNMTILEGGFDPKFYLTNDGDFNLAMARDDKIYRLKYSINQTIDFADFNITTTGVYPYSGFYVAQGENDSTYIINSEPHVSTEEFFSGNNLKSKVAIITDDYTNFTKEEIFIYNVPDQDNYHSFYLYETEDGKRIFTHTTLLTQGDLPGRIFSEEEMIAFYVSSDYDIEEFKKLGFLGLEELNSFQIFFKNVGIYLIIVGSVLALIVVLLRKRVKRSFILIKRYLTRPIYEDKSKLLLPFINFWVFISNFFSSLFDLFKTNKRRHLMNLISMTVLALIILTSTALYSSKREVLFDEYTNTLNILNDGKASLSLTYNYDTGNQYVSIPAVQQYEKVVLSEIFTGFKLDQEVFASIVSGYEYSTAFYGMIEDMTTNTSSLRGITYIALSNNYSNFINDSIVEGRLPQAPGEVLLEYDIATALSLNVTVNDTITFWGSQLNYYNSYLGDTHVNLTITGLFDAPTPTEVENIWTDYNLPSDSSQALASIFGGMVSFGDNAWANLEGLNPYYMFVNTYVQFYYDFTNFKPEMLTQLKEDIIEISDGNAHFLKFTGDMRNGYWYFNTELNKVIGILEPRIQSSMLLFFMLAVPILYLAIFLIFETNELYSQGLEQEIEIFQTKGLSSGRIAFNYMILKIFEAIAASFVGFGLSFALVPPLLKVDSFLTFNQQNQVLNFSGLGWATLFTITALIVVSIPKIIQVSTKKTTFQKTPQRLVTLLKQIRIPTLLLIGVGIGLTLLFFSLYKVNLRNLSYSGNTSLLMINIYLAGLGVLLALLGIGLLLKDLHGVIMIAISKISWNRRKTVGSFTLVEVRSDIKLFSNMFFAFLLIVGITIPSIMSPLTVEFNYDKDAYLYNGADIFVKNWMDQNQSLLPEIQAIPGVESSAFVHEVEASYDFEPISLYLIENTTEFLNTVYTPPTRLFTNWEETITALEANDTMLSTKYFFDDRAGEKYEFEFESLFPPLSFTFEIYDIFNYIPIFYTAGEYIPGVTVRISGVVMTQNNFERIRETLYISSEIIKDRLLIKLSKDADHEQIEQYLVEELDLNIDSAITDSDERQFETFPFFNIVSAEFALSMLVCLIAIAFISISNPIKILQQRVTKNDRLKKMGISTKRIIRLTMFEAMFTGIIPGLFLGTGVGFAIMWGFTWATKRFFYSGINYLWKFNAVAFIIAYIVAPVLFMGIFYLSMKRNYAKYMPRNLE
ncbi:MAG: hypothetical protein ACTSO5_03295 [Candidatus Heimdallarchaeaceae archaeon]